ncbi:MAG TPA: hypothetical protein VFR41_04140 [Acidimicrobiia bacterium]|nr:hypothetical protein [Acidimicrobiia bacterium]
MRRGRDIEVELSVDVAASIRRRGLLAAASHAAATLGSPAPATLLHARRICRGELMIERGLGTDGGFAGHGAHDADPGAEYGDRAHEDERFVVWT